MDNSLPSPSYSYILSMCPSLITITTKQAIMTTTIIYTLWDVLDTAIQAFIAFTLLRIAIEIRNHA